MINLESLFKNFFDDRISDDKMKKFTEDHLARLASHNDSGIFSSMLTETSAAYDAYFGYIIGEATHASVQKSLTRATDDLITAFKDQVSRHEGLIKSKYGEKSPAYLEFFPQGLTEYRSASKTVIDTLMNRFVTAVTKRQSELGDEFFNQFSTIRDAYVNSRKSQLTKKGDVGNAKTGTSETKTRLGLQLSGNVHRIALAYPGNPEKCIRFFDQSIIKTPDNAGEKQEIKQSKMLPA